MFMDCLNIRRLFTYVPMATETTPEIVKHAESKRCRRASCKKQDTGTLPLGMKTNRDIERLAWWIVRELKWAWIRFMDLDEAYSHALYSIVIADLDWDPAIRSAPLYAKYKAWVPIYNMYRTKRRGVAPRYSGYKDFDMLEGRYENNVDDRDMVEKLSRYISSEDLDYLLLRASGYTRSELSSRFFGGKTMQFQENKLMKRARSILWEEQCH